MATKGNPKGISDLKAITKADFARPSMFRVHLSRDGVGETKQDFFINCFQATVPGLSIATTDKDKAYRSVAYQKIYEDIELGFYCSGEMEELKYFQRWMDAIIRPQDNHVAYYDDYIGTIDIVNLSEQAPHLHAENNVIMTTKIMEAYPKNISAIPLDYGMSNDIMRVTVTITYRYYKQSWGNRELSETERNLKFLAKNLDPKDLLKDNGLLHSAQAHLFQGAAAITQSSEDLFDLEF